MPLDRLGLVKAHIPNTTGGELKYITVGAAWRDSNTGRIAIKLNAMPLDKRWAGWLNIFEQDKDEVRKEPPPGGEDDIPF